MIWNRLQVTDQHQEGQPGIDQQPETGDDLELLGGEYLNLEEAD